MCPGVSQPKIRAALTLSNNNVCEALKIIELIQQNCKIKNVGSFLPLKKRYYSRHISLSSSGGSLHNEFRDESNDWCVSFRKGSDIKGVLPLGAFPNSNGVCASSQMSAVFTVSETKDSGSTSTFTADGK